MLRGDPLPWLLDEAAPAVRHLALRRLLDRTEDDPDVVEALRRAMAVDPIAGFLEAQSPEGWWAEPGPGYGPKYRGTVWCLTFLDQMGADGTDPRIRAACEYVLAHSQASNGAFAAVAGAGKPVPSGAIHCLNGNLLRAMIGFGLVDDERVRRSIDWQVAAITGEGVERWYSSTSGPCFECGANERRPCAWGATKAVLALARIAVDQRQPIVARALDIGVEFLLSRDPAIADYPRPSYSARPNGSWFKLGFPLAYVTDVLQVLEALVEAGAGADPRLDAAIEWLLGQQDSNGRWANRYAYEGKLIQDIDCPAEPSRWVTLRACAALKGIAEARTDPSPDKGRHS
jgi:hypothetical protein